MMNLYDFSNYKDFLKNLVSGEDGYRGLRSELAKAMRCQAAYLTQVINAKADLTEEHGLRLSKHLSFSKLESQYLLLLIRHARASSPELKGYLEVEREEVRLRAQDLRHRVDSQPIAENEKFIIRYFSNWASSAIHVATSSTSYQTVDSLARRLHLANETVTKELQWLEEHGLVRKESGARWSFSGESIHLPKDSSLDSIHHLTRRIQAIQSIQQRRYTDDLHFSSLFTLDHKSFQQLRQLLAGTIEKSQRRIHAGGTDELYEICIDLFQLV
jgi:uncharacterized protein (TIGR02147 family)